MATAIYTARISNYINGDWFEFEVEVDVWDEDVKDYDPDADASDVYDALRDNLEIEWDFLRWEDLPEEDDNA